MSRFALRSRRVVLGAEGGPAPLTIHIEGEKIVRISKESDEVPYPILDLEDLVIMPGVVDTHAHINEPGRTDWEGFQTATRAAAAGGITCVIDMPLNSIPATTSAEALRIKAETAKGKCAIDYGFWGGVVPGNANELAPMVQNGAIGFKAFLCESGVDEFPMAREGDLRKAMPILARLGVPLLVHAELESRAACPPAPHPGRDYKDYLDSRPGQWEIDAIRMMIRLCEETGCHVHIVHLSTADALEDLAGARARGVPISAETCPHYLFFDAEGIHEGATQYKCAPPIREKANRERLWRGLKESVLDFVVSDHSPCIPSLKLLESGNFEKAWGGISGLQFSLSVVWTEMRKRGFTFSDLTRLMSANTARFAGLEGRKGRIAEGLAADLVIWDPERAFRVEPSIILHKNKLTPYEGTELFGRVFQTFVRGTCVYNNGEFLPTAQGCQISGSAK